MNKSILIVDDDILSIKIAEKFLKENNYEVQTAINGQKALEQFIKQPTAIVLTDLRMPVMDGEQLIKVLMQLKKPPLIIVISSSSSADLISAFLKKGVYDYITKPIIPIELIHRVNRAYESMHVKQVRISSSSSLLNPVSGDPIDFHFWREKIQMVNSLPYPKSIQSSLQSIYSFGNVLSVIEKFRISAKVDGANYTINKKLSDSLFLHTQTAFKIFSQFSKIHLMSIEGLKLEKVLLKDIYTLTETTIQELESYTQLNEHKIIIDKNAFESMKMYSNINIEYYKQIIQELIFNALKFSKKESEINVHIDLFTDKLRVSIVSRPGPNPNGVFNSLPEDTSKIFDPFYRKSVHKYKDIPTTDIGIGLCFIKQVIEKMDGTIAAHTTIEMGTAHLANIKLEFEIPAFAEKD